MLYIRPMLGVKARTAARGQIQLRRVPSLLLNVPNDDVVQREAYDGEDRWAAAGAELQVFF